jgi:hypothetical protein
VNPPLTDIYVVSQTARELVVVVPSYTSIGIMAFIASAVFLLVGYGGIYYARTKFTGSIHFLVWLLPLVPAVLFFAGGLVAMASMKISVSADTGMFNVRKTVLSVPISSQGYQVSTVRRVGVAAGDVCRSLYVVFTDRPAESLTTCTDRTGYTSAADALNNFLDQIRTPPTQFKTFD